MLTGRGGQTVLKPKRDLWPFAAVTLSSSVLASPKTASRACSARLEYLGGDQSPSRDDGLDPRW